jgi:hypothetical protein
MLDYAMLAAKQEPTSNAQRAPRPKRHADINRNAVLVAKIATGEIEDITTEDGKNAAAVALGRARSRRCALTAAR